MLHTPRTGACALRASLHSAARLVSRACCDALGHICAGDGRRRRPCHPDLHLYVFVRRSCNCMSATSLSRVLCALCNASIESGIFICRYNTFTMFTEANWTHHDMPRARCLALSEANSSDVAIKMSGALTTNSHSNEF